MHFQMPYLFCHIWFPCMLSLAWCKPVPTVHPSASVSYTKLWAVFLSSRSLLDLPFCPSPGACCCYANTCQYITAFCTETFILHLLIRTLANTEKYLSKLWNLITTRNYMLNKWLQKFFSILCFFFQASHFLLITIKFLRLRPLFSSFLSLASSFPLSNINPSPSG